MGAAGTVQTRVIGRPNIIMFNGRRSMGAGIPLKSSEINPPAIRANKVRLWSQAALLLPVSPGTTPFLCLFYLFTSLFRFFCFFFFVFFFFFFFFFASGNDRFNGARTTRDTPLTLILLPSSPRKQPTEPCGPPSVPDSSNNNFQADSLYRRRIAGEYGNTPVFPLSAGNFETVAIQSE